MMIQKKYYIGWRKREFLYEFFYEWLHCRYNILMRWKSCIQILFFLFFIRSLPDQSFSLYKKTICELQSVKCLYSMNYCALSHYPEGHVANKQLDIMHFCWGSFDDKSLSSLLSLVQKSVFPMHVSTNIVNTIWLKVYGYDYGMICFDTRFWYFTQDEENIFQHSKHKGYV